MATTDDVGAGAGTTAAPETAPAPADASAALEAKLAEAIAQVGEVHAQLDEERSKRAAALELLKKIALDGSGDWEGLKTRAQVFLRSDQA